jgi:hypothetical protein
VLIVCNILKLTDTGSIIMIVILRYLISSFNYSVLSQVVEIPALGRRDAAAD